MNLSTRLKRGVSIVEALASTVVVGFCVVMVLNVVPFSIRTYISARQINIASSIVQRELTGIANRKYPNIDATVLASTTPKPALLDSATAVTTNTYSFTNIESANNASVAQLLPSGIGRVLIEQLTTDTRRVTVTVTWTNNGVTSSYAAAYIMGNLSL